MIYFSIALIVLVLFNTYMFFYLNKFIIVASSQIDKLNHTQIETVDCLNRLALQCTELSKLCVIIDQNREFEGIELKKVVTDLNDQIAEQQNSFIALNAHVQKLCIRRRRKDEELSCD
jgi:hypothetical protein